MCIDLCRNIRLQLNTQMKQIIAGNWNQGLKIVDHFRLKLLINLNRERETLSHAPVYDPSGSSCTRSRDCAQSCELKPHSCSLPAEGLTYGGRSALLRRVGHEFVRKTV